MAMPSSASTTVVNLYSIDVGDLLEGSPLSEHTGKLETSLMLYLAPDRVRLDQATDVIPDAKTFRKYARGGFATPPPGTRGTLGIPTRASAEKGGAVFLRYIRFVQEVLTD
jgi:creatinine amidohydrolase/Fe(II)-dependent formamide hydrolase-like protein